MTKNFKILINEGKDTKSIDIDQGVGAQAKAITVKAKAGVRYQLVDKDNNLAPDTVRAKRVDKNLQIFFENSKVADLVIQDYYEVMSPGYNALIGELESGFVYEYIPESAATYDLIPALKDGGNLVSMTLGGGEVVASGAALAVMAFNPLLAAAGLGAAAAAAAGGGGNSGGGAPTPSKLTLAAPVISENANGGINAAESTNGTTVEVSLTGTGAVAGDKVIVIIDGVTTTYTLLPTDINAGIATVIVPKSVLDAAGQGAATVTANVADSAGNIRAESPATIVNIDTVIPKPTIAKSGDAGADPTDNITYFKAINVFGLEAGATWQFSINSGTSWQAGTGFSFDVPDATYIPGQLLVRQTDAAGNTSGNASMAVSLTVDTFAASPSATLAQDTGTGTGASTDKITQNGMVNVTGLENSATWFYQYTNASGALVSWTQGTGKSFTLPVGTATKVEVFQRDMAGNNSDAFVLGNVTVEATTPVAPVVPENTNGGINAEEAANGTPVEVSLTGTGAVAGDKVNVIIDGVTTTYTLLPTDIDAGIAIVTVPKSVLDAAQQGAAIVTATVTDAAGIIRAESPATTVNIDTVIPKPTIAKSGDAGADPTDNITYFKAINVFGLEAGATWQFSINSGTSWQAGTGSSFDVPDATYVPGQILVRQTDAAGNTSGNANMAATLTVDTFAAAPSAALAQDTGASTDKITQNGVVNVTGVEDGATWFYQYTNASGALVSWTQGSGTNFTLPVGTATKVEVFQRDVAGNNSDAFVLGNVTVDTAATALTMTLATDSGIGKTDRITNTGTVNVTGLEANASWEYSTNGGTTWTAATGNATSFALPQGTYTANAVQVRQTDVAGNTSVVAKVVQSANAFVPTVRYVMVLDTLRDTDAYSGQGVFSLSELQVMSNGLNVAAGKSAKLSWDVPNGSLSDGNTSTFVEKSGLGEYWVQIDLGANYAVESITATARAGWPDRLVGATIFTSAVDMSALSGLSRSVLESRADVTSTFINDVSNNAFTFYNDAKLNRIVVDTTTAAAPILAVAAGIVNLSGLEAGATWQYTTNGGTTWITGTATSYSTAEGGIAAGQVRVRQTDVSGNDSLEVTAPSVAIISATATTLGIVTDSFGGLTPDVNYQNTSKSTSTALWNILAPKGLYVRGDFDNSNSVGFILSAGTVILNPDGSQTNIQNTTVTFTSRGGASFSGISFLTARGAEIQSPSSPFVVKFFDASNTEIHSKSYTLGQIVAEGSTYTFNTSFTGQATKFTITTAENNKFAIDDLTYTTTTGATPFTVATSGGAMLDNTPAWTGTISRPLGLGETVEVLRDGNVMGNATISVGSTSWTYTDPAAASVATHSYTARLKSGATMLATSPAFSLNIAATPLVLDLNGDGVQTTSITEGTKFDLMDTGHKQNVGWVSEHDGLLSMDLNGDGQINSGAELFGDHTVLDDGSRAVDGWAALRSVDSNHDGKIDAQDAHFSQLHVWVDANGDGVTDAGELRSLADHGITSINLDADGRSVQQNGNVVQAFSTYTTTDGAKHEVADVGFAVHDSMATGVNTLANGACLDLSKATSIATLNHIDMTNDRAANMVMLTLNDVLATGTTNGVYKLTLTGDANDRVDLDASELTHSGKTVAEGDHTYAVYNAKAFAVAQLLIEQALGLGVFG